MNVILTVFNWVLISSLKACLIIPIIIIAKLVLKDKLSSSWHYFIWFLLVLGLILPVVPESPFSLYNFLPRFGTIDLKKYDVQDLSEKNIVNETVSVIPSKTPTTSSLGQTLNSYPSKTITTLDYNFKSNSKSRISVNVIAMAIWLTGVIVLGTYVIFINGRLKLRIWTTSQDAQESEKQILKHCKNNLNIRTDIPLLITSAVRTPVLFGFLRPSLLIPADLLDKINANELKHIFLHELTHFKRKDYAVNALIVLLKIIHWFNPLVWFGLYIMHQDSEIACDALVLSRMQLEERLRYGYTIIHLLRIANKPQSVPGTIGIMAKESKMKKRILMISSFESRSTKRFITGIVLLIALGSMVLTDAKNGLASQMNEMKGHNSNQTSADTSQRNDSPVKINSTAYLIDIHGQNFVGKYTGKIMVVPDPSKIIVGFSLKNAKSDKTTSDMAKERKAVGAINAGISNTDSVFGPAISPAGYVISDGKVLYDDMKEDNSPQDVAALTDEGKLIVGKYTIMELNKSGVKEAVSAGPSLIIDEIPQTLADDSGVNGRTAIGQKADGTVLLLVVNGRNKESIGATLKDVQNIFLERGVVNAALLDGGSLSTMYFQGNIVNHPPEGEQIVSSAFLVMP